MLIYDKDEDILTMADFDDEMMIQETSKGGHSLTADSADKLVTVQEEKVDNSSFTHYKRIAKNSQNIKVHIMDYIKCILEFPVNKTVDSRVTKKIHSFEILFSHCSFLRSFHFSYKNKNVQTCLII